MATGIQWTDETWNPIVGCSVVSPGCTNCYAMREAGRRLALTAKYEGLTQPSKAGAVWNGEVRFWEKQLPEPLRWRKPRRVFVNSMGDLFHESIPDEWIDRVFAVMALAPQHQFQVLTKRAERMLAYLSDLRTIRRVYLLVCDMVIEEEATNVILVAPGVDLSLAPPGPRVFLDTWPLHQVWLGVSAEDQTRADERIPVLLDTPAAVRFVSLEPLLGPIKLYPGLDWVIVGGESGAHARPMHRNWARSLRDQCTTAGVPFFMKQMARKDPIPADLLIREWPDAKR